MVKYAALLRGISPSNPNMRNEKLRSVFESLGFANVQTVISSGNVLFESPSENAKELETIIEKALPVKLGFSSTTIIRSKEELQKLIDKNPFKGIEDTPKSRFLQRCRSHLSKDTRFNALARKTIWKGNHYKDMENCNANIEYIIKNVHKCHDFI